MSRSGAHGEAFVRLHVESLDEGGFVATSPDLPGLVAQGRTIAETTEIAHDVARKLIESYREHGDPLPKSIRVANGAPVDFRIAVSLP